MYHIANGIAIFEFLITLYFKSELKSQPYVSTIGEALLLIDVILQLTQSVLFYPGIVMVLVGQTLRSTAMIHASSNFSHAVAFRKLETHRLVTDGVYA